MQQTAGVSAERAAKLSANLTAMLEQAQPNEPVARRPLAVLLGKLQFAAPFIQGNRAFLASSHRAVYDLAEP